MTATQVSLRYPWISLCLSLLLLGYFFIIFDPRLIEFYHIPEIALQRDYQFIGFAALAIIVLMEMRVFDLKRRRYERLNAQLREQVVELLKSKKALQSKAHTYSGHADKLKMFISERLLEYIEYDEKFLHFRSIAAEVRHNGVISYDKVQTALLSARNTDSGNTQIYDDATHAMIYLWDLLDLSTTDNIAMHVADYLCECEEHYFQQQFEESAQAFKAIYSAKAALLRVVLPLFEEDSPAITAVEKEAQEHGIYLNEHDSRYWVELDDVGELLGKDNYLVLLAENLLNNAMFFASKRPYANRYSRVSVQLKEIQGRIRLSVYNRGPQIDEADRDKIYQLGYSTRRVKEQNGRGLGLYFVHQLVKGYEGSIRFRNIENCEDIYTLRIALENGDIVSEVLRLDFRDEKPQVVIVSSESKIKSYECRFNQMVKSVEVSHQARKLTKLYQNFDLKSDNVFYDSDDRAIPRWVLNVNFLKRSCKVEFIPLNVSGVQFVVDLPSAQSRLDGDMDVHIEEDLDDLGKKFNENLRNKG